MFLTIHHSRFSELIPAIRPGDIAEAIIKEFRPKLDIVITDITQAGIYGTLDLANPIFRRYYGFGHLEKCSGVYFAEWSQVRGIYMKE